MKKKRKKYGKNKELYTFDASVRETKIKSKTHHQPVVLQWKTADMGFLYRKKELAYSLWTKET